MSDSVAALSLAGRCLADGDGPWPCPVRAAGRAAGRAQPRCLAALGQRAVLILLSATLVGCASARSGALRDDPHAADHTIYVVRHGWHTGIVVRRADVPSGLWPESGDFPAATFLEVGWGDRDFYMALENTVWLALKAAFWSRGSVLHVVGFSRPVVEEFPASEVVELGLARDQLERLVRRIHDAHARAGGGPVSPLAAGLYGNSRFYPARGHFHVFNNCNVWTARTLQAAGLPMRPRLALTASALIGQAARLGRCLRCED